MKEEEEEKTLLNECEENVAEQPEIEIITIEEAIKRKLKKIETVIVPREF